MDDEKGYIQLVKRARAGDRKSIEELAGQVRGRLYAYVYRIVLEENLAQDIVQESMLEMFKVLGKLEKADKFWPWLRTIAFSKLRRYHSQEKKHRAVSLSGGPEPVASGRDADGGLADLVADELRQLVISAMRELKPQHRRVLTMRCYEDMAYSEIAELMGCSELSARVTFCRAKRTLQKQLSRRGLGRGFMVTALVLFGKMTAPSEAAAAGVSVTAATTKAGVAASLASLATSKTGVVSVAAGCILATGTIVGTSWPGLSGALWEGRKSGTSLVWPAAGQSKGAEECWYYYPHDVDGPVMMRLVKWNPDGKGSYCKWWQNGGPSYYFDERRNTIHVTNERMWDSGLSVVRLPTDGVNMRDFLSLVEGSDDRMYYVSARGRGLLVITRWGRDDSYDGSQAIRHHNLLDEEYFRYRWPPDATKVDNRDAMHKRGWTYFTVSGSIGGEALSGTGRIPFVYLESEEHYPWLRVKVGERLRLEDDGGAASVYGPADELLARYRGGSFFRGLARPWMGLHTIDTVRRDAAEQRVWFETRWESGAEEAELSLDFERLNLVYTIDMNLDVVEKIVFESEGNGNGVEGEMRFSYLQEVDSVVDVFAAPRRKSFRRDQGDRLGIVWLSKLAADDW